MGVLWCVKINHNKSLMVEMLSTGFNTGRLFCILSNKVPLFSYVKLNRCCLEYSCMHILSRECAKGRKLFFWDMNNVHD